MEPSKQDRLAALISPELITILDEMIPEKCPDVGTPDRLIWHYAGQRSLVNVLRTRLEASSRDGHQPTFFKT